MANFYTEIRFFLQFAAVVVVYRLFAPRFSATSRRLFLILASFWFLSRLDSSRTVLEFMVVYIGVVYFLSRLSELVRKNDLLRRIFTTLSISLLVSVLVILKYRHFTEAVFGPHEYLLQIQAIEWIGLSYLTMRAIDYLLTYEYALPQDVGLIPLTLYLCFFSSFISGPIPRFTEFSMPTSTEKLSSAFFRIASGVIKIMFLGKLFFHASVLSPTFSAGRWPWLGTAWGLYAYLFYIYLDFSGYCDCAVAIATLFGLHVPENFNFPFFAANIQDFWNRWHISLSHWCRDHIFFSSLRSLDERFEKVPTLVKLIAATLCTFAIIGVWHGDSLNWLMYGLYHGAGVSILIVYRSLAESRFPNFYDRLVVNPAYKVAVTFLTFNFVSWGLLLTLRHQLLAAVLEPLTK